MQCQRIHNRRAHSHRVLSPIHSTPVCAIKNRTKWSKNSKQDLSKIRFVRPFDTPCCAVLCCTRGPKPAGAIFANCKKLLSPMGFYACRQTPAPRTYRHPHSRQHTERAAQCSCSFCSIPFGAPAANGMSAAFHRFLLPGVFSYLPFICKLYS